MCRNFKKFIRISLVIIMTELINVVRFSIRISIISIALRIIKLQSTVLDDWKDRNFNRKLKQHKIRLPFLLLIIIFLVAIKVFSVLYFTNLHLEKTFYSKDKISKYIHYIFFILHLFVGGPILTRPTRQLLPSPSPLSLVPSDNLSKLFCWPIKCHSVYTLSKSELSHPLHKIVFKSS